jgi:hypothetical protein
MMRVVPLAALSALVLVAEANAAMCIRLSTLPTRPTVGTKAVIQLRTYAPLPDGRLRPWAVRDYPFRMQAVSPSGRIHRVRVRPSADVYAWRGRFVFPERGRWTIRVANFAGANPNCSGPLVLRVAAARR